MKDNIPGRPLRLFRGRPIEVRWQNHLPLQHIFAVDPHVHGAMPPAPAVRTVPHLHGSRTSSSVTGCRKSGSRRVLQFNTSILMTSRPRRSGTTIMRLGITRLNVYAGLSGFYLLRDDEELSG